MYQAITSSSNASFVVVTLESSVPWKTNTSIISLSDSNGGKIPGSGGINYLIINLSLYHFFYKTPHMLHKWSHPCAGLERPLGFQKIRVPRISRQSVQEGDKFVSSTNRPPLSPRKYFWYSCLLIYKQIHTLSADKSLDLPGRKQSRKHVRDARDFNNIETRAVKFLPPPWQKH